MRIHHLDTGKQIMTLRQLTISLVVVFLTAFVPIAGAQEKQPEYRLGPGDTVRVQVYQNPDLTLETRVTENGMITYPLIGNVRIGGLTVSSAERVISDALRLGGYIKQPQVTVMPIQIRSNQVSVLGQVNRPGRYPLETLNASVSEVLAIAGGISPGGSDVAIVTGTRDEKPFRKEINIRGMFLDNKMQDNLTVANGDVIFVDRAPIFHIYGEVQKPGPLRLERNMTLRQALAEGGGPTARGSELNVSLYRRGPDGRVSSSNPDLKDPLQADDVIYVNESMFYIYGEVQKPGSYRVEPGMTFRQALAQGGGPTVRGTERRLKLFRRNVNGVAQSSPNLDNAVRPDDVLYVGESLF
jgi:polysaccharide biosynthesis/export protein